MKKTNRSGHEILERQSYLPAHKYVLDPHHPKAPLALVDRHRRAALQGLNANAKQKTTLQSRLLYSIRKNEYMHYM